jgi:hypothetical protein
MRRISLLTLGRDTLYLGPVPHFGIQEKRRWFWEYDEFHRHRKIGCGRWELGLFMENIAGQNAAQCDSWQYVRRLYDMTLIF